MATANKLRMCLLLLIISMGPASVLATPQEKQDKRETAPEENSAKRSALVGRVFGLKNRDPEDMFSAIRPLMSGTALSTYSFSRELRTLTIRDYPENVAAIGEAIKRLDVPIEPSSQPQLLSFDLRLDLITATKSGENSTQFTGDLAKVVEQLRSTLGFASYKLLSTILGRAQERAKFSSSGALRGLIQTPNTEQTDSPWFYTVTTEHLNVSRDASGQVFLGIPGFRFGIRVPLMLKTGVNYQDVGITNDISLKEGEKVVVGTTSAGSVSEAIIVVISFKKAQ